jgi:hypothetical protein
METVGRVRSLLRYVGVETLIEGVDPDDASGVNETIFPIKNPVGTDHEVAVVYYHGVEDPHKHLTPEVEAHVVARNPELAPEDNKITYYTYGSTSELSTGGNIVIGANTPHFAYTHPDASVPAVVISAPNFDPDRMLALNPHTSNELEQRTLAEHDHVQTVLYPQG